MRAMTMTSVPKVSTGQSKFIERTLSMGKKKKTQNAARVSMGPLTKYYKATYINSDGTREDEVYISENMLTAQDYAMGPNARDRILERVQEYDELIDAML